MSQMLQAVENDFVKTFVQQNVLSYLNKNSEKSDYLSIINYLSTHKWTKTCINIITLVDTIFALK